MTRRGRAKNTLRVTGLLVALVAVLASAGPVEAAAREGRTAFLVLIPSAEEDGFDRSLLEAFDRIPGLSTGLYSATQGSYTREQSLLDISQGTRVSRSLYDPTRPPTVRLLPRGTLVGWDAVLARARTAPQTIEPGLLAGSVPGGATLVRAEGQPGDTAVAATDRAGVIRAVKTVAPGNVARAAAAEGKRRSFVVVAAPPGRVGVRELVGLVRRVDDQALVIAAQSPPVEKGLPVFPVAVTGTGSGSPTSATTSLDSMVAAIDFAPTVLDHLGLTIPEEMTGTVIEDGPSRSVSDLADFQDRLDSLGERRIPAVAGLAAAWILLFLLAGAIFGIERSRNPVRRSGGLAVLWLPTVALLAGLAGNPPAGVEIGLIAVGSLALGAISDRLAPWPRAAALPALAGLAAYTLDLALGSPLVIVSVLGPSPGYGARFFGIGNELEAVLVVLLLVGLAALLTGRAKSRGAAGLVVGAAVLLGVVLGSGRLGAAVGGVVVVAAAAGVMAVMLLPGRTTPVRVAVLVAAPILALALLAGLDLLISGDRGHFARNVLGDGSGASLGDAVGRRLELAWQQLWRGVMPVATVASLAAAAFTWRNRSALEPFPGAAWPAALAGGLAGGLVGSFVEDSGPLLLVTSVLVLLGAVYYLLGRPPADGTGGSGSVAG